MLTTKQGWGILTPLDLEPIKVIGAINDIMIRMDVGGYHVSTQSSATVFGKTLYSVKFFKGEEVIHATGPDLLSCYQQALKEAHRIYRENLSPRSRDMG
jgi:hypothetical protein